MTIQELLSDKSKWCKHATAESISGEALSATSKYAVAWCLLGAIDKCYPHPTEFTKVILKVHRHLKRPIAGWNDHKDRTFPEVKQLVMELGI